MYSKIKTNGNQRITSQSSSRKNRAWPREYLEEYISALQGIKLRHFYAFRLMSIYM